jgi:hypothetical protein
MKSSLKVILVCSLMIGCGDPSGYDVTGNTDVYGGEPVIRYAIEVVLDKYSADETVLDGYTVEIFDAEEHPDIAGDNRRDYTTWAFGCIHTEDENKRRVRVSDDVRHLCETSLAHELAHVVIASRSPTPWKNLGHPARFFADGALVDQAQKHLCNEMGWTP